MGNVKHCAVIDFGVLCQAAAELLWIPGIEMAIEMKDSNFTPDGM